MAGRVGRVSAVGAVVILAACGRPSAVLQTAGRDADEISVLFWWMAAAAAAIWVVMTALALLAAFGALRLSPRQSAAWLIAGGGVVLPTTLLAVLLSFGLPSLTRLADAPRDDGLVVAVTGEQWWWRVRYLTPRGDAIDLANEIRLPVGSRTDVRLASDNVIHSFWIPSIAGKVDMIPGRVTHLSLEPTRTGVFAGVCAEYCGTSHARMEFRTVVMDAAAFDSWLANEAGPARDAVTPLAATGRHAFLANGCGACHTVRGTPAAGVIGPDLTHVGSRLTIAAAFPNEAGVVADWIANPDHFKPDTHMPAFRMLPREDLVAMAAYLSELR